MYACVTFTVPRSSIMISQSVDSPNVGDNLTLTCTVTVASGVSSSLVMVNWDRQDLTLPSSSISNTSISGLRYTRTVIFSPLLSDDGGQYSCSGSVDGFDEADNLASVMVTVNGEFTKFYLAAVKVAQYIMFITVLYGTIIVD